MCEKEKEREIEEKRGEERVRVFIFSSFSSR